uniref:28S ribosomal protein S22, mitochondrial-like n=1 Tax=Phallusia mammillata TaxID=59560 RepID=A0A6F9DLU6_9ASCI|nr:28S ribosomal protein S22, mitochondrial-like [Phallusia mammillata]
MTTLLHRFTVAKLLRVACCRSVYSGPEAYPVFSRQDFAEDDGTWEWKKLHNIRQRVVDIQNGINHEGDKKIVDDEARKVHLLPHKIYSKPEEYYPLTDVAKVVYGNKTKDPMPKGIKHKMDPDFIRPEVQDLLKSLTGRDPEIVFAEQTGLYTHMPRVRLLTTEQLNQEIKKMDEKFDEMLEMPPVMLEREEIEETIAFDELLDGYEEGKLIFTDITVDLKPDERCMVVREPTGLLRRAQWDERDRALGVYYPKCGRSLHKDPVFENPQVAFKNQFHKNILERILVEFVPDSKEFIHYTQMVYDEIDKESQYDLLRSTRFFGGLAFYLAKHKSIDGLLKNILENKSSLPDAADLVKLFCLINNESNTARNLKDLNNCDDFRIVQVYVQNDATMKKILELSLQTFQQIPQSAQNF